MMTDSIADLLTRIRNGILVRQPAVNVPYSRLKEDIVKVLKNEGWIKEYAVIDGDRPTRKELRVYLKYGPHKEKILCKIERVSKPGCRVYRPSRRLEKVLDSLGILILSTSKGVMSDRAARKANVGGEVLCRVY